jgi:hypothetical protein
MSDISGTTRAQSNFLRACTKDPWGLTHKGWPNAITFRRWMRRQTFRVAIRSIRDALRFQADLHIAAAAAAAAQALARTVMSDEQPPDPEHVRAAKDQVQSLTTLLKLAHLRQRFSVDPAELPAMPKLPPEVKAAVKEIKALVMTRVHPDLTVGRATELMDQMYPEWRKHLDGIPT